MLRYRKRTFLLEAAVVLISLVLVSPFYLLVSTSLKTDVDAGTSNILAPPQSATFDNFLEAWSAAGQRNLAGGMIDSAVITLGAVMCLIALGSVAAYTIGRRTGRLSNFLYVFFVIGIILPFQLGLVPAYIVMRKLGLIGTHLGMIILYTGLLLPLAVFLYIGNARSLNRDYEEAARVDGASRFQIFARVVFPLLAPATGTVAILTGMIIWNDFFTSLIFLSGSKTTTLPVALYNYVGEITARWNVVFAGVIISMAPVLALYLVAQRKFIQGFSGGLKG
jgi:raffinose/stachyose/melibiose transport system permease protein